MITEFFSMSFEGSTWLNVILNRLLLSKEVTPLSLEFNWVIELASGSWAFKMEPKNRVEHATVDKDSIF